MSEDKIIHRKGSLQTFELFVGGYAEFPKITTACRPFY